MTLGRMALMYMTILLSAIRFCVIQQFVAAPSDAYQVDGEGVLEAVADGDGIGGQRRVDGRQIDDDCVHGHSHLKNKLEH
jgi:hypothetical protein